MIYIDGVGYVDKTQAYKQKINNSGASFDSVYEAETIIYATPASNNSSSVPTNTTKTACPANLEGYFQNASNTYGIDINLLKAVAKVESNFNPSATSNAGAAGIMQLMPQTAASLGVSNPYNAEENIMGGAKYLSSLLNKYNGNISLALAAYNAGPGNVDKYNGIPPFQETQHYVNKVLNNLHHTNGTDYTGTNLAGSSADIIYAAAVNDASQSGNIYSIPAIPDSTL